MKRKSPMPVEAELMRELLGAIVAFMAQSGVSQIEMAGLYEQAVSANFNVRGRVARGRVAEVAYGCDPVAGGVLRAWHRSPAYLDAKARPLPLDLDGGALSLVGLVKSLARSENARSMVDSMRRAGLLKKCADGRYLPAKQAAIVGALDPLSVDHVAKTIIRLVETASRNMSEKKGRLSLIERYAHVPDMASKEARSFATFSRQQGQAYLDAIEDWLEVRQVSRRASAKGARSSNAGVHIFAFVGKSRPGL